MSKYTLQDNGHLSDIYRTYRTSSVFRGVRYLTIGGSLVGIETLQDPRSLVVLELRTRTSHLRCSNSVPDGTSFFGAPAPFAPDGAHVPGPHLRCSSSRPMGSRTLRPVATRKPGGFSRTPAVPAVVHLTPTLAFPSRTSRA